MAALPELKLWSAAVWIIAANQRRDHVPAGWNISQLNQCNIKVVIMCLVHLSGFLWRSHSHFHSHSFLSCFHRLSTRMSVIGIYVRSTVFHVGLALMELAGVPSHLLGYVASGDVGDMSL